MTRCHEMMQPEDAAPSGVRMGQKTRAARVRIGQRHYAVGRRGGNEA
jgi:hypothetical protein